MAVEVKTLPLNDLKPNPENPRTIKDEVYKKLIHSLKELPEMAEAREIVVNKDYVILGGNMRYRAMKELGFNTVKVKVVDWSEDKQRQFIIKDNISNGDWDWDKLANEWDFDLLEKWGMKLPAVVDDDFYTRAINAPTYEPTMDNPPRLSELVDRAKVDELLGGIERADVPAEVKDFLMLASYRHFVFDYSKIAEYYAHADHKVKELFESSALVIIDYKKAIEKGYVELTKNITEIQKEDYEE